MRDTSATATNPVGKRKKDAEGSSGGTNASKRSDDSHKCSRGQHQDQAVVGGH